MDIFTALKEDNIVVAYSLSALPVIDAIYESEPSVRDKISKLIVLNPAESAVR
jgi:hypothetical protein